MGSPAGEAAGASVVVPLAARRPRRRGRERAGRARLHAHASRGRGGQSRAARRRAPGRDVDPAGAGDARMTRRKAIRREQPHNGDDRVLGAAPRGDDRELDLTLRPTRFDEFVGQRKIMGNLQVYVAGGEAAQRAARSRALVRTAGPRQDHASHISSRTSSARTSPPRTARRSSTRVSSRRCSRAWSAATCCSSTRSTA